MKKKWLIKTLPKEDLAVSENLTKDLGISPILAKLLVLREIKAFDEAKIFFRPNLNQLHDPFLMKDMDKAVERLNIALRNKEKILVYGDYDVDGTTSVALFYSFLNQFSSQVDYYIPDRYKEGYGISIEGINYANENHISLIITLDCGIKAVAKVDYANSKGLDVIICDHHTPNEVLPNAIAVLNPKRKDCQYPYKHLSGCGVGFKLAHAFYINNGLDFECLIPFLDLLAVSIASDIVPIDGENRILSYFGMERLNNNPSKGLAAIICQCNLAGKLISISDVVFKIGPRINASGRIDRGINAVKLMIASNNEAALEMSGKIDVFNQKRKILDKDITQEALGLVNHLEEYYNRESIILYNENWSKGVIGIVASRMVEEFYRPTIILTKSNGKITGSARSVSGFNLYDAVYACREYLETFGGHKYAAGMTLKEDNIESFSNAFEQYVAENITEEQKVPFINIDCEISLDDITPAFCRILKQFAPHGPKNHKPIFYTSKLIDTGNSKLVGDQKQHLKLELKHPHSKYSISGILFNYTNFYNAIKEKQMIDVCYNIEENIYNGKTSVQMLIKDIRISQ